MQLEQARLESVSATALMYPGSNNALLENMKESIFPIKVKVANIPRDRRFQEETATTFQFYNCTLWHFRGHIQRDLGKY